MFFKVTQNIIVAFCMISLGATYTEYKNQYDTQIKVARAVYELSQHHEEEINKKREKINDLKARVDELSVLTLSVSAYTKSVDECDSDPEITSTMTKAVVGLTVAISRDRIHLLGRKVYIPQVGIRRITDLMGKGRTDSMDILMDNKSVARQFGRREMTVVIL